MPLFLVTGLPGSGKSTVCAELKARGYEAYDGDYDHLAKWYNTATGQVIEEEYYRNRSPEFLKNHSRDISRETIEDLANRGSKKSIFICGDPENEAQLQDLFEKIFALVLDDQTRNRRLTERTNNNWGKLPHERAYSEAFGKDWDILRQNAGYITIDATQAIKDIVDQILATTEVVKASKGLPGV